MMILVLTGFQDIKKVNEQMIGIRAHDIGKMRVSQLAKAVADKGCSCVHLALQKAITDFDFSAGKLNPGLAKTIREAFGHEGVHISVLGCYINPIHPDLQVRRACLEKFKEYIRFVRDFGCGIVATETGSLNADGSYHVDNSSPKTIEILVESVKELVHEAEKFGVFVCLEGATVHTVSSSAIMKHVIDRVQSNNLQVLFDPANLLNASNISRQQEVIMEAFKLYGDKIIAVHAKDFILENADKKSVPIGKGLLDYPFLMKMLRSWKPGIEILMEDTRPEWIEQSKKTIEELIPGCSLG